MRMFFPALGLLVVLPPEHAARLTATSAATDTVAIRAKIRFLVTTVSTLSRVLRRCNDCVDPGESCLGTSKCGVAMKPDTFQVEEIVARILTHVKTETFQIDRKCRPLGRLLLSGPLQRIAALQSRMADPRARPLQQPIQIDTASSDVLRTVTLSAISVFWQLRTAKPIIIVRLRRTAIVRSGAPWRRC
jgi:hypothetical protein